MNDVKERLDADLSKTNTLEKLNELKTLYMGKKGIITELTLKIKDLQLQQFCQCSLQCQLQHQLCSLRKCECLSLRLKLNL